MLCACRRVEPPKTTAVILVRNQSSGAEVDRDDASPISSGIDGLDYILRGGYAKFRSHLVEGRPGSGKTTLGLQFLIEGGFNGERCLYITLSESKRELLSVATRLAGHWRTSRSWS